jgi:hypothetical protein
VKNGHRAFQFLQSLSVDYHGKGKKRVGRSLLTNGASEVQGHTMQRQDYRLPGFPYFYSVHVAKRHGSTAKQAMAGFSHFLT